MNKNSIYTTIYSTLSIIGLLFVVISIPLIIHSFIQNILYTGLVLLIWGISIMVISLYKIKNIEEWGHKHDKK